MCICKNEYISADICSQTCAFAVTGKLTQVDGTIQVEFDLNPV